jgi:hypothetical protein
MTRLLMRHPEDEQMLRYADGELPARAAGEVRSHLEACWQCRAQLEELQNTVGECVSYRKSVLQRHLPPVPVPWTDIYQRFSEIDASLVRPGLLDRAVQALRWPMHNVRIWAPVAVALLLVVGLYYQFRTTPSVQASELLSKAVIAANTHPMKARRIEIRTKQHHFTRFSGTQQKLASSDDTDTINSLQTMFRTANYDWDDPLSAKAYQAWRNQLASKQDQVVQEKDAYRIQTSASSGELMEASLKLRSPDLEPVEGRFEFRNREWVEISEIVDAAPPSNSIAATDGHPLPNQPALPAGMSPDATPPPIAPPAPVPTVGDELHVWAALHQAGADLGDPIEVSRTDAEILITGVGIPPQRQREIQDAIGSQSRVVVRFSDSAPATVRAERPVAASPPGVELRQLQARLADKIGGRANFEQLASDIFDLSEPMMSRAYALRRLAQRFPTQVESQLSAQDRQLLRQLTREHTAALRRQTAELDRLLKPVLGSGSGTTGGFSSNAWQPATEDLFQSARRVEKLLAVIFGAAPGESADDQLPSQLLASLTLLRAKVEGYDGLISNTGK